MNDLSAEVAAYRKYHGVTQEQLADMAGVSRGTIRNVESGAVEPTEVIVAAIRKAMKDMNPHNIDIAPRRRGAFDVDHETDAMAAIARLDEKARERVIRWMWDRFGGGDDPR